MSNNPFLLVNESMRNLDMQSVGSNDNQYVGEEPPRVVNPRSSSPHAAAAIPRSSPHNHDNNDDDSDNDDSEGEYEYAPLATETYLFSDRKRKVPEEPIDAPSSSSTSQPIVVLTTEEEIDEEESKFCYLCESSPVPNERPFSAKIIEQYLIPGSADTVSIHKLVESVHKIYHSHVYPELPPKLKHRWSMKQIYDHITKHAPTERMTTRIAQARLSEMSDEVMKCIRKRRKNETKWTIDPKKFKLFERITNCHRSLNTNPKTYQHVYNNQSKLMS